MLNGRLYRVSFVPFLLALAVAAFSLGARPAPLSSTLAPDAFEGDRAFAELGALARAFPERAPGSAGDERLAAHVASTLRGLGGGFSVRTRRISAQTIDGQRTLSTVIATRPGSTGATPLLIVAHRDAAGRGAIAELSSTAALLELARVFATRETKRTIVIVSTSGGSGGDGGASRLAGQLHGPFDAGLALGDLAGVHTRRPFVIPYSDGFGSAPLQLQRTVADAIKREAAIEPGAPSVPGQLAHLLFPLAAGEQGALNAHGIPSVLVQVSGESGPSARERVDPERLELLGRAVLSAVDALDAAPDITSSMQTGLQLQRKLLPEWTVTLLIVTLLLPAFVAGADGLAGARRRKLAVGRWALWTLSCALPFLSCALFCYLLGWLGILGAAPAVPVLPSAMPFDGEAATAVGAATLTFVLSWLLWASLLRRVGWRALPDAEVAGLPLVLVIVAIAVAVWIGNPYAALLLLPAAHLWLVLAAPELRPRRTVSLGLVVLGLVPLALLVAFYVDQLALGPGQIPWTAVLLLAGGHVGMGSALLWSAALGCAAGAALLAIASERVPSSLPGQRGPGLDERHEITIRGPLTYAGPGSLGGTESALRR
jgi:Peptidase family M28